MATLSQCLNEQNMQNKFFVYLSIYLWISPLFSENNMSARFPELWNVPEVASNLLERTSQETELEKYFSLNKHGRASITGVSGIGKSELAKYYLNKNNSKYKIVWWFDATKDLTSQFYQFAVEWNAVFLNPNDQIPLTKLSIKGVVGYMKNHLRRTEKEWIIIFDNAISEEEIKDYIPLVHQGDPIQKHVLITSQNQNGWPFKINLTEFSEEEALLYTKQQLPHELKDSVNVLISEIGRIPFYLGKTVDYIRQHDITIKDYLMKYTNAKETALSRNSNQNFTRVDAKINEIKKKSTITYDILALLSLSDRIYLPHKVLDLFVSQASPTSDFLEILKTLDSSSFLQKSSHRSLTSRSYCVHDLVRSTVRKKISKPEITLYTESLSQIFVELLEQKWEYMIKYAIENPGMISQAQVIWDLAVQEKNYSPSLFRLGLILMEYHMYKSRDHNAYEALFLQLKKLLDEMETHNLASEQILKFYINSVYIRDIYKDKKLATEVGDKLQEAVNRFSSGKDYDLQLRVLYNFAQYYLFQGELEKAKECLTKAEPLIHKATSRSNINLYWYVKAWTCFEGADYAEANKALDQFFSTFDVEQNFVIRLYGMNMRAHVYLEDNKIEQVLDLCSQILAGAKDYFQSENSEVTAEALTIKAKALIKQKKFSEAQQVLEKSLKIYDVYFGGADRHQDQGLTITLLGQVCEAQENNEKALAYFLRAQNIYDTLYGKNLKEVNAASNLFVYIAKLGIKLNREDLAQKYLRLHVDNFGLDHDGTVEILKALGEKMGV